MAARSALIAMLEAKLGKPAAAAAASPSDKEEALEEQEEAEEEAAEEGEGLQEDTEEEAEVEVEGDGDEDPAEIVEDGDQGDDPEEQIDVGVTGDPYPEIIPETFTNEEAGLSVEVLNVDEAGAELDDGGSFFSADLAKVDQGLDDRAKLMAALKVSLGQPAAAAAGEDEDEGGEEEEEDEEQVLEEPLAKRARTAPEMPMLGGAPPRTASEAQSLAARKAALLRNLAGAAGAATAASASVEDKKKKKTSTSPVPSNPASAGSGLGPGGKQEAPASTMTPEEYEAYRQQCWLKYYEQCNEWQLSYEQSKRVREQGPRVKGKDKGKGKGGPKGKNDPAPPPVVLPNPAYGGIRGLGPGKGRAF